MPFTDYIATLQELLAATPFVTGTSLSYEERPPSVGLIKGWLVFTDGSQLDVKEGVICWLTAQTNHQHRREPSLYMTLSPRHIFMYAVAGRAAVQL